MLVVVGVSYHVELQCCYSLDAVGNDLWVGFYRWA
jgi:hypothetical protein